MSIKAPKRIYIDKTKPYRYYIHLSLGKDIMYVRGDLYVKRGTYLAVALGALLGVAAASTALFLS